MAEVEDAPIELEHAIGFSALPGGLHYHTNGREYLYAAGASIVIADFNDAHAQTFLRGHDGPVTCVALSKRGTYVGSGQHGENADAIVWRYDTRELLFRLSEHDTSVACLAFSDDELLVCTCGGLDDGKLIVWDLSSGYKVATVGCEPALTTCMSFGGMVRDVKRRDTGEYQLCTCGGSKLVVWALDPYTGSMRGERVTTEGRGSTVRTMTEIQFSEDQETIYCATKSGDFALVNVKKRALTGGGTVSAAKQGLESLAIVGNQNGVLLCGGGDGTVTAFEERRLLDVAQVQLERGGAVVAMSMSPDGSEFIAGLDSGAIYRVRADLSAALLLCENHLDAVKCVAYSADSSERFASASADRSVRVWDANDYRCACKVRVSSDAGEPAGLAYTMDFLICGWSDGRIRAFDADNGAALWSIDHAHKAGVTSLVLSNNARFILSGGEEGDVRVWELRSRELVSHLKEHRGRVTGLAMYGDDAHALSCSRDRSFLCWDLRREKRMTSHTQRMGGVNALALSRDETNVFTVGQEKRLTRWDLRDPLPIEQRPLGSDDDDDEAVCVAVSNGGHVVATAGSSMLLKLFDARPGNNHRLLAKVQGHSARVTDLKFAPDDKQLITSGDDGLIFVWNLFLDI